MRALSSLCGVVVVVASTMVSGCDDPCGTKQSPTAELGLIVGASTFEPVADGATVTLGSAPQGGQGIFMAARTNGLESHPFLGLFLKRVELVVRVIDRTAGDDDVLGEFPTASSIECVDGEFGIADGVVFGLDSDRFGFGFESEPNENLAAIDGHTVTLEAELTDENGAAVTISQDVVLDTVEGAIENP